MRFKLLFRNPRTRNEMWQYYATTHNEDGVRVRVRGPRKPKHLPNSWDDIPRKHDRCWKNYRRTRWKPV